VTITNLFADSHSTGNFLNPNNALGDTPTTWAGELNTSTSATSRWNMENPANPLTTGATQTVEVTLRKGSNSGTPTASILLYESTTLKATLVATTSITSTTGQVLSGTFASSLITNPNNVRIEVVMTAAGGGPSVRNSAQVSHIKWIADHSAPPPPTFDVPMKVVHARKLLANPTYNQDANYTQVIHYVKSGTTGYAILFMESPSSIDRAYIGEVVVDLTTGQITQYQETIIADPTPGLGANSDARVGLFAATNQFVISIHTGDNYILPIVQRFSYGNTFGSVVAETALVEFPLISNVDGGFEVVSPTHIAYAYIPRSCSGHQCLRTLHTGAGTISTGTYTATASHPPTDFDAAVTGDFEGFNGVSNTVLMRGASGSAVGLCDFTNHGVVSFVVHDDATITNFTSNVGRYHGGWQGINALSEEKHEYQQPEPILVTGATGVTELPAPDLTPPVGKNKEFLQGGSPRVLSGGVLEGGSEINSGGFPEQYHLNHWTLSTGVLTDSWRVTNLNGWDAFIGQTDDAALICLLDDNSANPIALGSARVGGALFVAAYDSSVLTPLPTPAPDMPCLVVTGFASGDVGRHWVVDISDPANLGATTYLTSSIADRPIVSLTTLDNPASVLATYPSMSTDNVKAFQFNGAGSFTLLDTQTVEPSATTDGSRTSDGAICVFNGIGSTSEARALQVWDTSDPANPVLLSNFDYGGYWGGAVHLHDTGSQLTAFVGRLAEQRVVSTDNYQTEILAISLDDPSNPVTVGTLDLTIYDAPTTEDIDHIRDGLFIVALNNDEQVIFDATDRTSMSVVGTIPDQPGIAGSIRTATALTEDLIVIGSDQGLAAVDVTNAASPTVLGLYPGLAPQFAHRVSDVLLAATSTSSPNAGLTIVDFTEPATPRKLDLQAATSMYFMDSCTLSPRPEPVVPCGLQDWEQLDTFNAAAAGHQGPATFTFLADESVLLVYSENGAGAFAPNAVHYSWPATAELSSFAFPAGYVFGYGFGTTVAPGPTADTFMMAQRTNVTKSEVYIDRWGVDGSGPTRVATFTAAMAVNNWGWKNHEFIWNPDGDFGFILISDVSSTVDGTHYLARIDGNGTITFLDAQVGDDTWGRGLTVNADWSKVYWERYDPVAGYGEHPSVCDVATGAITDYTTTNTFTMIRPGLAGVGAEPLGDGVHFYRSKGDGVRGYDREDIDTASTSDARTVGTVPTGSSGIETTDDHNDGGTYVYNTSTDDITWWRMTPRCDVPCIGDTGPWVGYIGIGSGCDEVVDPGCSGTTGIQSTSASATGASIDVPIPAGAAVGDTLMVFYSVAIPAGTACTAPTAPVGWSSQLATGTDDGGPTVYARHGVMIREVTGTEGATVTISNGQASAVWAAAAVWLDATYAGAGTWDSSYSVGGTTDLPDHAFGPAIGDDRVALWFVGAASGLSFPAGVTALETVSASRSILFGYRVMNTADTFDPASAGGTNPLCAIGMTVPVNCA
jgi:hypothetical protein